MKNKFASGLLLILILCLPLHAFGGSMPYNIPTIADFLSHSGYFNGFKELESYDFNGAWDYTAIGFESGNINWVQESTTGPATFTTANITTANTGNFGAWNSIDFDKDNLYFQDSGGPYNVPLDKFFQTEGVFRLFQLTENSNLLSYLTNHPITLLAGTLIIGFNDNGYHFSGDQDFDDIIVAATPSPVPEPATLMLLGTGLMGIALISRKKIRK